MTESPELHNSGQVFEGKYELLERLGSGGVGTVFKARQLDYNRIVAIKILHEHVSEDVEFKARFLREAQTLSKLSHPNIVSVYHLGQTDAGELFIVMEFIEGRPLNLLLSEKEKLPANEAIAITRDLARGLAQVHEQNIVHRDLKPGNIVITNTPQPNTPKIIDFGLARVKASGGQKLTSTGLLIGTPDYMSPEQCTGMPVDAASDIYSLTLCLYEMLCGHRPFEADAAVGMMYKHLNEAPPPLKASELDKFHPSINDVIQVGLAKKPEKRFKSMTEFAATLDELHGVIDSMKAGSSAQKLNFAVAKRVLISLLLIGVAALSTFLLLNLRGQHNFSANRTSDDVNRGSPISSGDKNSVYVQSPVDAEVRVLLDKSWNSQGSGAALSLLHAWHLCEKNPTKVSLLNRISTCESLCIKLRSLGFNKVPLDIAAPFCGELEAKDLLHAKTSSPVTRDVCNEYLVLRVQHALLYAFRLDSPPSMENALSTMAHINQYQKRFELDVPIKLTTRTMIVQAYCSMFRYDELKNYLNIPQPPLDYAQISTFVRSYGQINLAQFCLDKANKQVAHVSRVERVLPVIQEGFLQFEKGETNSFRKNVQDCSALGKQIKSSSNKSIFPLIKLLALAGKTEDSLRLLELYYGKGMQISKYERNPADISRLFAESTEGNYVAVLREIIASARLTNKHKVELLYGAAFNTKMLDCVPFCHFVAHNIMLKDPEEVSRLVRLHLQKAYAKSLFITGLPWQSVKASLELIEEVQKSGYAGKSKKFPPYDEREHAAAIDECAAVLLNIGEFEKSAVVLSKLDKNSCWELAAMRIAQVALHRCRMEDLTALISRIKHSQTACSIIRECVKYRNIEGANRALQKGFDLEKKSGSRTLQIADLYLSEAMIHLEQGRADLARLAIRRVQNLKPEKLWHASELRPNGKKLALLELLTGMRKESAAHEDFFDREI